MSYVVANPGLKWEGFQPTPYTLNRRVLGFPITEVKRSADGAEEEVATTIGDIYSRLEGRTIELIEPLRDSGGGRQITTDTGTVKIRGLSFHVELLEILLELRRDGYKGYAFAQHCGWSQYHAHWFWYDSDHVTEGFQLSYSFFVVCDDKIVRECVSFGDHTYSGFDPTVFDAVDQEKPVWTSHPSRDKAFTRYWYRRFYRETRTGQLMVLRPDEPTLHFYPEGRWNRADLSPPAQWRGMEPTPLDVATEKLHWQLMKIQWLLWAVILLLALFFYEGAELPFARSHHRQMRHKAAAALTGVF